MGQNDRSEMPGLCPLRPWRLSKRYYLPAERALSTKLGSADLWLSLRSLEILPRPARQCSREDFQEHLASTQVPDLLSGPAQNCSHTKLVIQETG